MRKRVYIWVILFIAIGAWKLSNTQKKIEYTYLYKVPSINKEKQYQDFLNEVDYYSKKIKKYPSAAQDITKLAQLYLERAKTTGSSEYYFLAAKYAYKSIRLIPKYNPGAYYVLAEIAQFQHKFDKAIDYAQTILKQKKMKSPEAYFILASSSLALGNLEEAMSYADELISIFPSEKAYTLRASILSKQGRDLEAIVDFEEAIDLLEDDPLQAVYTRAMFARFFIFRSSTFSSVGENFRNAKNLLNESLRIFPNSLLALGLMGDLYEKEKNYNEAIKYYKLAFKQSKQLEFLFKEAKAHNSLGDREFANTLFAQIESLYRLDLTKTKNGNAEGLIRLLLERGNPKDFGECLGLAIKEIKLRSSSEAFILYAKSLVVNNQLVEARKLVRSMLSKKFHSEEVIQLAAVIEEKLKNKNLAKIYKNHNLSVSLL